MQATTQQPHQLLRIDEVARRLNVHRRTVERWVKMPDDPMPAHKLGPGRTAAYRFDWDEVDAWFRSRCSDRTAGDGAAA